MAPATSGFWSSHDPTAKTVTGVDSRLAAASRSWRRPTSPEPWNVKATRPEPDGPWLTKAAGPAGAAGTAGALTGVAGESRWPAGGAAGRPSGFAGGRDDVQAPRTAAEAAPRKARRERSTAPFFRLGGPPVGHPASRSARAVGAQPRMVLKLNTPGEDGF